MTVTAAAAADSADPESRGLARWLNLSAGASLVWLTIALIALRLIAAGVLPLSGDEALYWSYSKHLAPGYIDHPFMNPLMIRIGTTLFGDTSFGVRFMSVMLAAPATWAVWRATSLLFADLKVAATGATLFNLTLAIGVGSLAATSDMVVVLTSAFLLYFLAEVEHTGKGSWWLAVGAAFGLGLCSKYTTAFFAVSILLWLALVPERRKWLLSPWSWAGGAIALGLFTPVLAWNAAHQWASFGYQSQRMVVEQFTLRYAFELVGSQILLLSPPIAVLVVIGLCWPDSSGRMHGSVRVLLTSLAAPILVYFLWHSLHQRVQGNWPEPAFPALVVAAAAAAHHCIGDGARVRAVAKAARRLSAPVGLSLAAFAFIQAALAIIPIGKGDPVARILAYGMKPAAARLDALRVKAGATMFLTTDYTMRAWLSCYLPKGAAVEQIPERIRWVDAPAPDAKALTGPMIYVCKDECAYLDGVRRTFQQVEYLETVTRERGGRVVGRYSAYRVDHPTRPALEPVYPAMKTGARDE